MQFASPFDGMLYAALGINAELVIDHAWGWEPTEIKTIKSYKPETNSISSGQVLMEPYWCNVDASLFNYTVKHLSCATAFFSQEKSLSLKIFYGYNLPLCTAFIRTAYNTQMIFHVGFRNDISQIASAPSFYLGY